MYILYSGVSLRTVVWIYLNFLLKGLWPKTGIRILRDLTSNQKDKSFKHTTVHLLARFFCCIEEGLN